VNELKFVQKINEYRLNRLSSSIISSSSALMFEKKKIK
jgi:hypothetical protein